MAKIPAKKLRRNYIAPSDGRKLDGTTTIIHRNLGWSTDALVFWSNKLGREGKWADQIRDEAADKGTLAHAFLEWRCGAEFPDVEGFSDAEIARAREIGDCVLELIHDCGLEVVSCEEAFTCELAPMLGYGGTIDLRLRCTVTGELVVGDLKTSRGVWPDFLVQLGAYAMAHERIGWGAFQRGVIFHAPMAGGLENHAVARAVHCTREELVLGAQTFMTLMALDGARAQIAHWGSNKSAT